MPNAVLSLATPLLVTALLACSGDPKDDTDTDTDLTPVCLPEDDKDGDGFCPPEDCDDDNLNVYPGANEIPYNNRDDDCDGDDLMDVDGDGFNTIVLPASSAGAIFQTASDTG